MNQLKIILVTMMQILIIKSSVRWVDEADKRGPIDMDIFFDRVVLIGADFAKLKETMGEKYPSDWKDLKNEYIAPGVFVTHQHILTSYNPFRRLFIVPNEVNQVMFVSVLMERAIIKPKLHQYKLKNITFHCGHQIIPIPKHRLRKDRQMHGNDGLHSPVHDLMVLQIESTQLNFTNSSELHSFDQYIPGEYKVAGPTITTVATKADDLSAEGIKFVSLGFKNIRRIKKKAKLVSRTYDEDENVLVDCEELMPVYWGYFICVRNDDHQRGASSGALLFHDTKLFGVGSFALTKCNESILVFTDVGCRRFYYDATTPCTLGLCETSPPPKYLHK